MVYMPLYNMSWIVSFHSEFEPEFEELPEAVQDELLARLKVLEEFGPALGAQMSIRLISRPSLT